MGATSGALRNAFTPHGGHRTVRTWLVRIAIVVGGLIAALGVALGVAAIWVHTDAGHRRVARSFESLVNGQISGRMRVGEITDVTLRGIHAHDVRFSAPDGDDVIVADDVTLDIRWLALLHGRFVASLAQVHGGRVVLHESRDGLDADLAFRNPHPGPGAPSPQEPSPLDLERIEATDIRFLANLHAAPAIVVSGVRGILRVWIPFPGGAVRLAAHDLGGHAVVHAPIPVTLAITSGTMLFDGGGRDRATIDVSGVLNDVHVHWTNSVIQRGPSVRVVSILTVPDLGGAIRETPVIAEGATAALISAGVEFSVRIAPVTSGRAHGGASAHTP